MRRPRHAPLLLTLVALFAALRPASGLAHPMAGLGHRTPLTPLAHVRSLRGWLSLASTDEQRAAATRRRARARAQRAAVARRRGLRAVSIARTWLGVPYAWGGASRSGTDCSGLVMAVYGRLGIHLAHYTGALWDEGRRVPLRDLRPGDLVFFDGLGHVGIYAGAGRYIHAPQTGEVVRVDRLAARPLDGAVRIAGT